MAPPNISRIAILPPALADQIAAGEVVERAASVVKELCENAIDAGARRIEVDIEGGGRRLIRVIDDGGGMSPEEARLAMKRHATSKITSADDLWGLTSFGFRGEALPSIAAVSRLSLSTKVRGPQAGFRLDIAGGAEVDAGEIGIPEGTQIEVRDLFLNTPARLKFQKTDATESANVNEALLRLGLSHPEIHFRLRLSGRLALDLPPHRDLAERVRAALARRGMGALHEIYGEESGHRVHAFVAGPEQATTTARSTFLFVGRRYVRDRALMHALALGYGGLLDKGRYPLAVLFLEVPGAELDVNVHPQKLEVRFARASEVYAAVRHVVSAGVARAPWFAEAEGRARVHSLPPTDVESARGPASDRRTTRARGPGDFGRSWGSERRDDGEPGSPAELSPGTEWGRDAALGWGGDSGPRGSVRADRAADDSSFGAVTTFETGPSAELGGGLRYLATVDEAFWVCETHGALVLLDPHTVHEQILLRQLEESRGQGDLRSQKLLFAVPIELDAAVLRGANAQADALVETLRGLGIEVDPPVPGRPNALLLRAMPALLADADPKPVLAGLLEVLASSEPTPAAVAVVGGGGEASSVRTTARLPALLSVLACEGSVRAGVAPSRARTLELLSQVVVAFDGPAASESEFSCRRGRRLSWLLSLGDLHDHFGSK
jgi:DNA mismatch repair protein MutL